jgi:hypothetical protein
MLEDQFKERWKCRRLPDLEVVAMLEEERNQVVAGGAE